MVQHKPSPGSARELCMILEGLALKERYIPFSPVLHNIENMTSILSSAVIDLKSLFLSDHPDHNARDEEGLWRSCCHFGSFQSHCQTGMLSFYHILLRPDALVFKSLLFLCQGFKDNLHAVFCLAENAVGPIATRPDDIHTLYSGK